MRIPSDDGPGISDRGGRRHRRDCVGDHRRLRSMRRAATSVLAMLLAARAGGIAAAADKPPATRLVVEIIVDQLRGDLALRSRDRWSSGGFRRLYEQGAVFSDAHHGHANTETIVGHATLATGADPSVHGMVGNVWLDRAKGDPHYNIEDSASEIVGSDSRPGPGKDGDKGDKAGAATGTNGHADVSKPCRGRSPQTMLAPTIADSVAQAGRGKAKVFAVSLKDRAAVPMGGHTGKALWMSDATGQFESSSYYYPDRKLPAWVVSWNKAHHADHYDGKSWKLLLPAKTYRFIGKDDQPWESPPAGMTRTFPHRFDRSRLGDGFYPALEASPFGDDLLVDFTRALIHSEHLGHDSVVDYLSVSFSSNDYIGHRYGPDSLEMEDEVLRIDRRIAELMKAADDAAGSGHTLFVLTADHGVAEPPEELAAQKIDGGHILLSAAENTAAAVKIAKRVGTGFIRRWPPYIYLDRDALLSHGIEPEAAERSVAAEIAKLPGVAFAFTRGDIQGGKLPDTLVARSAARSFHPERSGDIHVVAKPGWQISFELPTSSQFATGHGTPWDYDTFVPLIFCGPGVPHAVIDRRVDATDVAPTIAALIGVPAPARATGDVLAEAVRKAPHR
ncbi:MAG TPA: alkaline phosphatase family protein [Candidatus Limnocylindrales bacterium]|nr:alkaline phosphatase family protein [Candidatus Limnocylindrales bacterium]